MKKMGDFLLSEVPVNEIVIGNTAVVRAMIETGVRVVSSYPGSPTPEIANAIASIPIEKRPFYFEFSVNEKVATEVAFGASINGHLSCVFFKSVGINVAADTFVQLGLMEMIGGMVIILGDDPGANSSQNEQDNRHFSRLSYIPMLEPATPTEVYQMFKEAVLISKEKKMPVILRMSTHVCHAKEKVAFKGMQHITQTDEPRFSPKNGPYIPLTSKALEMKREALQKLAYVKEISDESVFNFEDNSKGSKGFNADFNIGKSKFSINIDTQKGKKRGIITAGVPYLSLKDLLEEVEDKPDILKLGFVNPVPENRIKHFLKEHEEVKILEELDDYLEQEIKRIAYDAHIKTKIIGKLDIEDWIGEYTPDKVRAVMAKTWKDFPAPVADDPNKPGIDPRPAQMCPGCGHRSAFYAIKKALDENDITVADIGCHTLGALAPYNMGQVLLCMGHSNGTASGLGLFNQTRRIVSFLGDSTFFHAGIPGIINAIFNNHNHTLILMENGTTAMTGHQEHPATGRNFNEITQKIPIKQVLEGFGITDITEVDTYSQKKLTEAVKESVNKDGFNVVIAKHPCMLKFTREQRRAGRQLPGPVQIGEKCNRTYECISEFACPTFQLADDGSVWVQDDLCIGDRSCMQTCPVQAIEPTSKRGESNG